MPNGCFRMSLPTLAGDQVVVPSYVVHMAFDQCLDDVLFRLVKHYLLKNFLICLDWVQAFYVEEFYVMLAAE